MGNTKSPSQRTQDREDETDVKQAFEIAKGALIRGEQDLKKAISILTIGYHAMVRTQMFTKSDKLQKLINKLTKIAREIEALHGPD
jgi:SepF-like predicted cell division protein (DUF552 family)